MIKTLRFYIVITFFASLSAYSCGGDILDGYITGFIAKSDSVKSKSPASVDNSEVVAKPQIVTKAQVVAKPQIVSSSPSEKKVESNDPVKTEVVTKPHLNKSKVLREELKDSSLMSLPRVVDYNVDFQLKGVLSQLKSLRFAEMGEVAEPELMLEPEAEAKTVVAKDQPNATEADDAENPKSQSPAQKAKPFVVLPEDTSGVIDSFQLAESLFRIGDKINALKFYRKAFKLSLPVDSGPNPKRAWILFQIGNSLYSNDGLAAIKIYEQLVLEHPNSEWTNCAKTKTQVLKWLQVEKPMALTMSEVK